MNLLVLAGGNWIYEVLNTLWLLICDAIYMFIGLLYQVFEKVTSVNLFSTEIFEKITGRIYLVIGIAMLFIFAYNIILAIINPDGKDKGTSQMMKMVKETIISLVLVILLPTIFNYLYILQTHILESNIIGTIVLGSAGSTAGGEDINGDGVINSADCEEGDFDCSCDFTGYGLNEYNKDKFWFWESSTTNMEDAVTNACKNYRDNFTASQRGAYIVAPTIFSAFYRPTGFTFSECASYLSGNTSITNIDTDEEKKICVNYFTDVVYSKYTGLLVQFTGDSYLKDIVSDSSKDSVRFDWIMAIVAGVLAIYMFFCYAMEIGVRVAKLGFLQLISPIPVMMRIIPGQKEKMFDKWFTQLKNTYLDVFIRLAIIYFALFGVSLVEDVISTMFNSVWSGKTSTNIFEMITVKPLVTVFVILGLLKFAQEAPGLLKEFFGGMGGGNFSLKSPRKQLQENKLAMGGIGAIAGGAQNMIGNMSMAKSRGLGKKDTFASAAGGFIGGARRGAMHGYRTNDFAHLGGELRQAKYETDEAKAIREERKKLAKDSGYGESALVGKILQTKAGLESYLTTDGSTKVAANAASLVLGAFDKQEGRFKKPNVTNVDTRRSEFEKNIEGAVDGTKVGFGGSVYQYDGSNWRVISGPSFAVNPVTNEAETIMTRLNDYIDREKRLKFAENYKKEKDVLISSEEFLFRNLNENLSKLGDDFTQKLLDKINSTPIYDSNGYATNQRLNVSSLDELKNTVNDLIEKGNFTTVFEINDKTKGIVKTAAGKIDFDNAAKDTKDGKK